MACCLMVGTTYATIWGVYPSMILSVRSALQCVNGSLFASSHVHKQAEPLWEYVGGQYTHACSQLVFDTLYSAVL